MKWMSLVFAALFACVVNMSPAMAHGDDHHDKYKQHESERGHDNKDDDERGDDESKSAKHQQNSASSTGVQGTVNNDGAGVNVNFSKWWPF